MTNPQPMPHLGVIGHVEPAWKGDSLPGIQRSHDQGFTAQDVNVHVTKDGHVVGAHNAGVGDNRYFDPSGKIKPSARIGDLTLAQCQTLRPRTDGPERIDAITNWLPWCAENGFALLAEWKPDEHTADDVSRLAWRRVAEECARTGAVVVAATIQCWAPASLKGAAKREHLDNWEAGAKRRMRCAANAGVPTLLLYRRPVSADWLLLLSAIKGGPSPKGGVAHLGNGVPRVTKFGGSVEASKVFAAKARVRKLGGTFPPKVAQGATTTPPVPTPTPVPTPEPTPTPAPPEVPVTTQSQQQKVIAAIKGQVGYHEGRSGGHWNNVEKFAAQVPGLKWVSEQGQPWCAVFAAWGFGKGGLVGGKDYPVTASCDVGGNWYKARKRWSEYPAIGAQVFFGSPRDLNHTGIVVAYNATTITTVEGNTNDSGSREGDGVYLKTHRRRDVNVVGYGYPLYRSAIQSADPAWAGGVRPNPSPRPSTGGVTPWPIDGIDLSHHNQGRIDWALAKAGGVKFVYHKCTQHTAFRDSMYASRRAEVKAQRIPFGAYHYAQPDKSSGLVQARFFLAVAKPVKGELPPMLDLEESGGLSMARLTDWADEFADEVERQTGERPELYTKFDLTRHIGCRLWAARYSNKNDAPHVPGVWRQWSIHQFSNGEFGVPRGCPGIAFPVDLNTLAKGVDITKRKL